MLTNGGSLSQGLKDFMDGTRRAYAEEKQALSEDQLKEECDADLLGAMMQNPTILQEIARELERRKAGMGAQLIQSFLETVDRILATLSRLVQKTPLAATLYADYTRKRAQVASLLADFSERYRDAQPGNVQGQDARFSLVNIEGFGLVPVAKKSEVMPKGIAQNPSALQKWIQENLNSPMPLAVGGDALADATHLARSHYGTSGNRRENVARGRGIGILPDILKLFKLDDEHRVPEKHGKANPVWENVIPFVLPIVDKGEVNGAIAYDAKITIKGVGGKQYAYDVTSLKKNPALTEFVSSHLEIFADEKPAPGAEGSYGEPFRTGQGNTDNVSPESGSSSGNVRLSIGNIWHGTSADFDAPSLHYVGTGEGTQIWT